MSKPQYKQIVFDCLPRLLSALDRNPASPTYGCFDRDFWHHRQTDFAAATAQLSIHTLALVATGADDGFFEALDIDRQCLNHWIIAAIQFTLKIQHRDGSFDEWYPNERGWAGPTGYVAHALFRTMILMSDQFDQNLQADIEEALLNAARHLAERDETETLANHYAIAVLPIAEIAHHYRDTPLREAALKLWGKLQSLQSAEGWALEYDGCDIGYSLGTLSFLAEAWAVLPQSELLSFARRSFEFLSYFAFSDGSWGGAMGSRHTVHSYPMALEFWSHHLPEAHVLLKHGRNHFHSQHHLRPQDQDDHYLHYRLADYCLAAQHVYPEPINEAIAPFERGEFKNIWFQESGFWIERRGDLVLWLATRRGGALRLISLNDRSTVLVDNGILIEAHSQTMTSLWQHEATDLNKAPINGRNLSVRPDINTFLYTIFKKRFTPITFIAFRIASLFAINVRLAAAFKLWIRRKMITTRDFQTSTWSRAIQWSDSDFKICDELTWREKHAWKRVWRGGAFHTRHVPQAVYFSMDELRFQPQEWNRYHFKNPEHFVLTTTLNINTGEITSCAQ